MPTFANTHITIPAGAAIDIALPNTKITLSQTERTITFPSCGFRYGGNSKIKEDGKPFNIVFDNILDINKVIHIPKTIIANTVKVATIELLGPVNKLPIKIVAIVISIGNLPLHGTKLFVSIAIIFSLGESIILHPTIPAALHPNPMHIVSACFPVVQAFLKKLSKLKAILGR